MKKLLLNSLPLLFAFSSLSAAETYYLDTQTANTTLSATKSSWYRLDGENKIYDLSSFTDATNNYVIDASGGKKLTIDTDFVANSFTSRMQIEADSLDRKIEFNEYKAATGNNNGWHGVTGTKTNIVIGTYTSVFDSYWTSTALGGRDGEGINSLYVKDSLQIHACDKNSNSFVNVRGTNGLLDTTQSASIENPNAIIAKTVSAPGGQAAWNGMMRNDTATNYYKLIDITANTYMWIGNLSDHTGVFVGGTDATTSTGKWTTVFTNASETIASSDGNMWEGTFDTSTQTAGYRTEGAKLALVMRSGTLNEDTKVFTYANGTQELQGDNLYWSGGVTMISGKLLVNYNATNQGDETHNHHGDLTLARADGASSTTFGSCGTTIDQNSAFAFKDLVVSDNGGTIQVRLTMDGDDLKYDAIKLVGSAKLAEGATNGVVKLGFVNGSSDDPDEMAYFMSKLISIDNLTDAEKESSWTKLIAWSEKADSNIAFEADDWTDADGNLYSFQTFNGDSGLYGAFVAVAVPEPSTYAIIFGALALGLALYRRRK